MAVIGGVYVRCSQVVWHCRGGNEQLGSETQAAANSQQELIAIPQIGDVAKINDRWWRITEREFYFGDGFQVVNLYCNLIDNETIPPHEPDSSHD